MTSPPRPDARRWLLLGGLVLATLGLGLAVRFGLAGLAGDLLGGALYAVLVFQLVTAASWLIRPRAVSRWWRIALLTAALCWGVELLQLTGLPEQWAAAFPPARLVFGTTFSAPDLPAYVIGAALAAVVASRVARPRQFGGVRAT
ncbi:ribosomal maturation YjgA family protein [Microterricola pindariensis]|uniref:DUF2809 domain-containing protein n=1 Tax=Microterricola pindariensis TaxID=478010 RepID=A0ABX5ARE9_9MICO|nr:DUF2809 domain-containing protein [Microterricola pindariensis]PPL14737.1 hypothetical protein GY24_15560 [Microterricola pindariensis]